MIGFNVTAVLPGSFQPDWMSGCQLWLRADQGITLATGVSQWNDLSGNGNNVAQATGSKQPTYNATDVAYNGMPTLSFTSSNIQVLLATMTLTQPFTVYVVGQATYTGATLAMVGGNTSTFELYFTGGSLWNIYAGSAVASTNSSTSPVVLASILNGTSSAIYVNSSAAASGSGDAGTDSSTQVAIGGVSTSVNPFNGKIAEVLIYNSVLSTTQLGTIFQYLGNRYGITAS